MYCVRNIQTLQLVEFIIHTILFQLIHGVLRLSVMKWDITSDHRIHTVVHGQVVLWTIVVLLQVIPQKEVVQMVQLRLVAEQL